MTLWMKLQHTKAMKYITQVIWLLQTHKCLCAANLPSEVAKKQENTAECTSIRNILSNHQVTLVTEWMALHLYISLN